MRESNLLDRISNLGAFGESLQQGWLRPRRDCVSSWNKPLSIVMLIVCLLADGIFAKGSALAQDAANGTKTHQQIISYIMLSEANWPNQRELEVAIRKRLPGYRKAPLAFGNRMARKIRNTKSELAGRLGVPPGQFKSEIIVGNIATQPVLVILAGGPNPLAWNETFFQSAWWWRSAYNDVAKRKAHIMVSIQQSQDPLRDHLNLAQITAALIEKTKAIGVIWDSADAIYRADRFVADMTRAKDHLPPELAINVKLRQDTNTLDRDGQPTWLAITHGLQSVGLKEIEYRGFKREPEELVRLLWRTSGYLIKHGDVIKHNDTIGSSQKRQYFFRIEPSTLGNKSKVLRMREVPPEQSKFQPKDVFKPKPKMKQLTPASPEEDALIAELSDSADEARSRSGGTEGYTHNDIETELPKVSPRQKRVVRLQMPDVPSEVPQAARVSERRIIRTIQIRLKKLGCYRGTIDGKWGPQSQKALVLAVGSGSAAYGATSGNLSQIKSLTQVKACVEENKPVRAERDESKTRTARVTRVSPRRAKQQCMPWSVCMSRCNDGKLGRNAGTGCSYICGPEISICP